jgi:hypothetical protein
MLLSTALKHMVIQREALLDKGSASNPTLISEHSHLLSQYLGIAEERLSELEYDLEINESRSFHEHIKSGKSVNAAKETVRREFTEERATIAKTTRLISSGWKLVSECQSRVKHLIAEANNQI